MCTVHPYLPAAFNPIDALAKVHPYLAAEPRVSSTLADAIREDILPLMQQHLRESVDDATLQHVAALCADRCAQRLERDRNSEKVPATETAAAEQAEDLTNVLQDPFEEFQSASPSRRSTMLHDFWAFLEHPTTNLNDINILGRTLFTSLAHRGWTEAVAALLKKTSYTRVNDLDSFGHTALHVAVAHGQHEVAKLLLESDRFQAANLPTRTGATALHLAQDAAMVDLLLGSRRFTCSAFVDKSGGTALHTATRNGLTEVVKALIANGRFDSADVCDDRGNTALHLAAWRNHTEIVNLLLGSSRFTAVEVKNSKGNTARQLAEKKGAAQTVRLFTDTRHTADAAKSASDTSGINRVHSYLSLAAKAI